MIYTITVILFVLVAINFALLKFSCNNTIKTRRFEKPHIVKPAEPKIITNQPVSGQLAPTGS